MQIRTDLALERMNENISSDKGVHSTVRGEHFRITDIKIDSDFAGRHIGKPKGRYLTLETNALSRFSDFYQQMTEEFAAELSAFLPEDGGVLITGLGNSAITPDALGSEVVDKLLITSHIKKHMPDVFDENYSNVSAIAPGVMGTTGIETVEIVKGVIDTVRPDTVIAIDALAGADINRVTTSIQIADTGIAPGSGVGNHRNGLNEDSLGVKVIAVGVPTVIAAELLGGENLADEFKSLMVTTNDIDMIIKRMSKTVANGINMALHKNLSLKEAEELVG